MIVGDNGEEKETTRQIFMRRSERTDTRDRSPGFEGYGGLPVDLSVLDGS